MEGRIRAARLAPLARVSAAIRASREWPAASSNGLAATAESRRTVKHRADACRIWIGAPATSEGRSRRSSMGPGPPHLGDEALPATRSCRGGGGCGTDRGTPYLLLVAVPVVWPWLLRNVCVPLLLVVAG